MQGPAGGGWTPAVPYPCRRSPFAAPADDKPLPVGADVTTVGFGRSNYWTEDYQASPSSVEAVLQQVGVLQGRSGQGTCGAGGGGRRPRLAPRSRVRAGPAPNPLWPPPRLPMCAASYGDPAG